MGLQQTRHQQADSMVVRLQVQAGERSLSEALFDDCVQDLPVTRLVEWAPGWGPVTAHTWLQVRGIWPMKQIGQLERIQKVLLACDLRWLDVLREEAA